MRIPNAEKAIVDRRKVTEYCLNPHHRLGKNKAKVFLSALGFERNDAEELIVQLLTAVNATDAILGRADEFGQRYIVDFEIERISRKAKVRSVWIVDSGKDFPRFVTCFIL